MNKVVFQPAPAASIQQVQVSPSGLVAACASWDNAVYLYSMKDGMLVQKVQLQKAPLDIDFMPDSQSLIIACSDHFVYQYVISTKSLTKISSHLAPVRNVCVLSQRFVASGGYDEIVQLIDLELGRVVQQVETGGRVFKMSYRGGILAVATSGRAVQLFKFSGQLEAQPTLESPLRHQTRGVWVDESGAVVLSSVEGRVAVEGASKFAFRAHKLEAGGEVVSYPVNGLAGHNGLLLTAGGDGNVYFWNLNERKKVYKISESGCIASIAAAANVLLIGLSNDYSNGEVENENIQLVAYNLKGTV